MFNKLRNVAMPVVGLVALSVSTTASALITSHADDFEAYTQTDPMALETTYLVFGNVEIPAGTFAYGYGPFPAPNNSDPLGPQAFSAVVLGEGDVPQGAQQLSVYPDFENGDHAGGANSLDAIFYKEYTIDATNIGETWTFGYEHKLGNLVAPQTAEVFVQVLDSVGATFAVLGDATSDMSAIPATWGGGTVSIVIDPAWTGQLIQFGMRNTSTAFGPGGIFYDNITFDCTASCSGVAPAITPWTDDFEAYTQTDPLALETDYLVFGNVSGTATYGYGPFPAPNNSDPLGPQAFSAIVTGEGDVPQGAQQLSVYPDFENADHGDPTNTLEAIFYREDTVGTADVGTTWDFSYDLKLGNLVAPATAEVFVQVLDSVGATFAVLGDDVDVVTTTPATWSGGTVSILIDPSWVGQLIQFGMRNTSASFGPGGIFYDNLCANNDGSCSAPLVDTDGDTIPDAIDNCTLVANTSQFDGDADGHGNACDADLNNSCGPANVLDLFVFKAAFGTVNPNADMNGSGGPVNVLDLFAFKSLFGIAPGPSAAGLCP